MKINRFIALAAAALLVIGAMGVIASRSFALGSHSLSARASLQQDACAQDQAEGAGAQNASETDNVDLQCGDQNSPDSQKTGSDAETVDGTDTAPTGVPSITAEQAQTAALAVHSGTVLKTELADGNGALVYSVNFDDGVDVKVDAMTGAVLSTETSQD